MSPSLRQDLGVEFMNLGLVLSFDIMAKRLYKNYVSLSNIIVRVSDGTEQGKEHAVLVNSHLDSTLPSPGAADDALSVGVMLECIRVLIHTPDWQPTHAIIFCEYILNVILPICLPPSSV